MPFEMIPDDWACPACGVGKSDFEEVAEQSEKRGASPKRSAPWHFGELVQKNRGGAVAAQIFEPEFEGKVFGVVPDGSSKKPEKHNVRMRTGAGVCLAGFAASKSKTKIFVEGGSASVRFDAAQPIALIVRAKDNKADPISIAHISRMKSPRRTDLR